MTTALEPGLLNLFRWYVGIRLGFLILLLADARSDDPSEPVQAPGVGIVLFGALLIFLLVPWFQRVAGRAFLPIAIVMATVAPIADATATISHRLDLGYSPNEALTDYWLPFFLLFVPFILIAWQYRYRWVLLFAVGSTVIDMVVTGGVLAARADDFAPTGLNLEVLAALLLARGALFAFLGFFISKLVARQREDRDKLRGYAAAIEQVSIGRERNRLARELHDTLAHTLSGIAVQLEAASTVWDVDPAKARALVDAALDSSRTGLGEARRAIEDLRAAPLEDFGLVGAMQRLVDKQADLAETAIDFRAPESDPAVRPDVEHAVYRATEEALNNVIRHAQADNISVAMTATADELTVLVRDDGVGFDSDAVPDGHHGLRGIEERIRLTGGTLRVMSAPGEGTTVEFTVPIGDNAEVGSLDDTSMEIS